MCVHTYSCGRSASPSVVEVTDSFVLQGTLSVKGRYKLESCTFKIGFEGCTSLSVAVRVCVSVCVSRSYEQGVKAIKAMFLPRQT